MSVCVNEHVSFLALLFPVARNNFKVLIYFKISYLIYAELFFTPSSSTPFLNLVFFSLNAQRWSGASLFFSMNTLYAMEITEQNFSIHSATEKPRKFLARSFRNKFHCLFTGDTLTSRTKCVFVWASARIKLVDFIT